MLIDEIYKENKLIGSRIHLNRPQSYNLDNQSLSRSCHSWDYSSFINGHAVMNTVEHVEQLTQMLPN